MRKLNHAVLAAVLAGAGLLVPAFTSPAQAAGALDCTLNGFVVKDPTLLADPGGGTNGSGQFGSADTGINTIPSNVECAGSLNGTAQVSGSFVWCPQSTSHDPSTNPHPDDPTAFDCNGAAAHPTFDEALYPGDVAGQPHPSNVHVVGSGTLHTTNWITPDGTPGPSVCDFEFEGHALLPVRLDVSITCDGTAYTGHATANVVPVLGVAGDVFVGDPNPQTCADAFGPTRPDCFRAVVFNGAISAANTDL